MLIGASGSRISLFPRAFNSSTVVLTPNNIHGALVRYEADSNEWVLMVVVVGSRYHVIRTMVSKVDTVDEAAAVVMVVVDLIRNRVV